MSYLWSSFVFVSLAVTLTQAGELTFELPDNEKQCFYEVLEKNVKCTLEFQVVTGGNYDVDMELTGPNGRNLYKDTKKQYDSFTWTTDQAGEHRFCFSNEFSTFTHKIVYFDFQVGEEQPLNEEIGAHVTAMTQDRPVRLMSEVQDHMETSAVTMHESLKIVLDYQTHHRLRETQGRAYAEDLNERVQLWSIGQSIIIVIVGLGQILILRSFFTDKHAHSLHANT